MAQIISSKGTKSVPLNHVRSSPPCGGIALISNSPGRSQRLNSQNREMYKRINPVTATIESRISFFIRLLLFCLGQFLKPKGRLVFQFLFPVPKIDQRNCTFLLEMGHRLDRLPTKIPYLLPAD